MQLTITPDVRALAGSTALSFLGPSWLDGSYTSWQKALHERPEFVLLDLSGVSFVPLFDWLHVVSMIELLIREVEPRQFDIDLLGKSPLRLLDPSSLLSGGQPQRFEGFTLQERDYSVARYRLAGFLESLDTYGVLNSGDHRTKVIYPGISRQAAALKSFYSASADETPKVVLGLQRIATKDDCKLFLSDANILNWRKAMDTRFPRSPLFESDEV